jgi:hypothetical protein
VGLNTPPFRVNFYDFGASSIFKWKTYLGLNLDEVKSNLFSIFDRYSYLGDIPHAKDKYKHLERTIKELE